MVSEHALERIRFAFIQLSETRDLGGWRLDPMGSNYNERQETDDVDIHLHYVPISSPLKNARARE
jgi:hypothetical protein